MPSAAPAAMEEVPISGWYSQPLSPIPVGVSTVISDNKISLPSSDKPVYPALATSQIEAVKPINNLSPPAPRGTPDVLAVMEKIPIPGWRSEPPSSVRSRITEPPYGLKVLAELIPGRTAVIEQVLMLTRCE